MKPAKNEARMSTEVRLAVIETNLNNLNSTMLEFKHEMSQFKQEMKHEMSQFRQDMKNGFERVDARLWAHFFWLMSMIIGLAGLIAHTQHWI